MILVQCLVSTPEKANQYYCITTNNDNTSMLYTAIRKKQFTNLLKKLMKTQIPNSAKQIWIRSEKYCTYWCTYVHILHICFHACGTDISGNVEKLSQNAMAMYGKYKVNLTERKDTKIWRIQSVEVAYSIHQIDTMKFWIKYYSSSFHLNHFPPLSILDDDGENCLVSQLIKNAETN